MYSLGSKDKELSAESSQMLLLLNTVSQFEQQKSLIDHEWVSINNELKQLQQEYKRLISDQLKFYGLDSVDYRKRYIEETLDSKRDEYKNFCRKKISERMAQMDADKDHRGKWMGEVETYMYQVQSIRLRFGQLTSRMLSNINRYEQLIAVYSDDKKFPSEFTTKIKSLATSLSTVKGKFYTTFNPMKYIEDSAVMYIERIPD